MSRRFLAAIRSAVLLRPRAVLAASAVLLIVAALLSTQVELRTSRAELAPPDDPDQQRFDALLREYRGSEALIACVDAPQDAAAAVDLRPVVERLAAAFGADPRVEQVFYRVDVDWFLERALHLVPADGLHAIGQALQTERELLDELPSISDLARLNERLAARLERGLVEATGAPEAGAVVGIDGLTRFLGWQGRFLEAPAEVTAALTRGPVLGRLAAASGREPGDGFLKTHDGKTWFLFLSPRSADDRLDSYRDFVEAMRERAREVTGTLPGVVRVAFTGQPALVVDEMDSVRRDTWRTSAVALVGVSLLTLLVFRWRSHALLVLLALGAGVLWSLGAVQLELGYLNMITSSFISTLIGVGVAYGIHPVSEYELEGAHTSDPVERVRTAFGRTGPGVVVAGLTTSAAFFSIQLMQFRGFSELGIVAGFGVLLCLLAATVTLPALLVVYGTWRHRRSADEAPRGPSVVDRVWVEHLSGRVCSYPRAVTALALAVTVAAAWAASGIRFDTNLFDLLPREAESLRYQRRMILDSDLSPLFNIVAAADLGELESMRRRAATEPDIERFESVLDFLPAAPERSRRELDAWRDDVLALRLPERSDELDRDRLAAAFGRLESVLAESADAAFGAGIGPLAGALEDARAGAQACRSRVAAASDARVAAWNAAQGDLLRWLYRARDELARAVRAAPPTVDSLPEAIRKRFVTGNGALLGFLFPRSNLFEERRLDDFVAASRRVDPGVTGFPLVFHKMSGRITSGFYRAVLVGLGLVTLILLVDYRSVRDCLLALVPLAMGVAWMMGGMRLLGISFNFANLVAVPLILGVGIDNGVHVVHRVRLEGRRGMHVVLRHTGRAILIASLTTMIGFGSLALASHRGMASLGLLLLLGVGSCLVTSTIVLPNLLVALGFAER